MRKKAILRLAIKTIFRQKSRNIFIIFIVCLTCVFSLLSSGLFEGKNKQIEEAIIETETGLFQIIEKNYFLKNESSRPLSLTESMQKSLSGFYFTPELLLKTTILNPEGSQELTVIGIDPKSHANLFNMKDHVQGEWPIKENNHNSAVIGKKFAERFKLRIGDQVVLTFQNKDKSILNESLQIVGIYSKNGEGFEKGFAYVHKNTLQKILQIGFPRPFHRIIFSPKNDKRPLVIENNFLLKKWNDLHPELSIMMKFHNGVTRVLIIFMLVIAYVSITTPLNILWEERAGEIRLLRTLGTSNKILYALASAEALVLTIFSLVASILIWLIIHLFTLKNGIDFSIMGEESVTRGGILISSIVRPSFNFLHSFIIILFHGMLIFLLQILGIRKLIKRGLKIE